jgi:hypothetical protein
MNKKFQELALLILTTPSVIIILLQYGLPLTQVQMQFIYILDLIIVGILVAGFYNRTRKEEKVSSSFSKIAMRYPL